MGTLDVNFSISHLFGYRRRGKNLTKAHGSEIAEDEKVLVDNGGAVVPTFFVEALTSAMRSGPVHRLIFGRSEIPEIPHKVSVFRNCVQITLTRDSFIDMYAFLKVQIDDLVNRGIFKQDEIDAIVAEKTKEDDREDI